MLARNFELLILIIVIKPRYMNFYFDILHHNCGQTLHMQCTALYVLIKAPLHIFEKILLKNPERVALKCVDS